MSAPELASEGLRLNRWLWQARFFKTRALAAQLVGKGRVRINQAIVTKAYHRIRPGDVLTFPQGTIVRVVRVVDLGNRCGPAREAQCLYEEDHRERLAGVPRKIHFLDLDRQIGHRRPRAALARNADLRRRRYLGDERHDPAQIHHDLEIEQALEKGRGAIGVGGHNVATMRRTVMRSPLAVGFHPRTAVPTDKRDNGAPCRGIALGEGRLGVHAPPIDTSP